MRRFKYIRGLNIPNVLLWLVWPLGLLTLFVLLFFTCSGKGTSSGNQDQETDELSGNKNPFPMIEVPAMLSEPAARAAYLSAHYWDRFNFADTAYIHLPEITEQAFVNFLSVLPHTDNRTATSAIQNMLQQSITQDISGAFYGYLLDKCKYYLDDPNSPLRNEEFYLAVTAFILSDKLSDKATKSRADFDQTMMLKNRIGTKAVDFSYRTIDGKKGDLYAINSNYIILFFYNPDCQACTETIAYLASSSSIHHLLKKEMLTILTVYPDEDLSAWQAYRHELPDTWINSRDQEQVLNKKQLYDLKAIPSLYLLDKDKKVLLKDTEVRILEEHLKQIADIQL